MRGIQVGLVVVCLASCATPYQPRGFRGGYSDEWLGPGFYFVEFQGNRFTSRATVMKYLHRRAAELCHGAGYQSYVFVDRADEESVSFYASRDAYGNAHVKQITKPGSSALVRCTQPRYGQRVSAKGPPGDPSGARRFAPVEQREGSAPPPSWYCTSAPNANPPLGMCFRAERDCETLRVSIEGVAYSPCAGSAEAICFVYEEVARDGRTVRIDSCHPDRATCFASYDYTIRSGKSVTAECTRRR